MKYSPLTCSVARLAAVTVSAGMCSVTSLGAVTAATLDQGYELDCCRLGLLQEYNAAWNRYWLAN